MAPDGCKSGMKERVSEVWRRGSRRERDLASEATSREERGARQRRALLPHGRTKRRGASWESEPCVTATAAPDELTMAHARASYGEKKRRDAKSSLVIFNCRKGSKQLPSLFSLKKKQNNLLRLQKIHIISQTL